MSSKTNRTHRGGAGRHGRKSGPNKCARSECWYSVARAISRTGLRISQCMWLREAPNLGRGGARTWRSYFRFCVKRFCECSNCTVSSGLCAGRLPSLFLLWAQKCQKRPWQWYCVEVFSTTDMEYCVARQRKHDHEKNDVKTQS